MAFFNEFENFPRFRRQPCLQVEISGSPNSRNEVFSFGFNFSIINGTSS